MHERNSRLKYSLLKGLELLVSLIRSENFAVVHQSLKPKQNFSLLFHFLKYHQEAFFQVFKVTQNL